MKLTDNDFTSHACDDPNKDGDGLGWNLEADLTTEGKNEIIQNQKLRGLIDKKIENLPTQIKNSPSLSWRADYELLLLEFQTLLGDSKK